VVAELAAMQLSHQHQVAHLELALEAGRRIGVAVGILATRLQLQPAAALDLLKTASQHRNHKLRRIADKIINDATDNPGPTAAR